MMFSGSLIEDLIATVERAEASQSAEVLAIDSVARGAWFASVQETAECDSDLLSCESGVA